MSKSFTAGLLITCLAIFVAGCAAPPEQASNPADTKTAGTTGTTGADSKSPPPMTAVDFAKDVKPTVEAYCLPCHAGPKPKGEMDVTKLTGTEKETFGKMARMVESGKMPPPQGKPIPDADKAKLVDNLKKLSS